MCSRLLEWELSEINLVLSGDLSWASSQEVRFQPLGLGLLPHPLLVRTASIALEYGWRCGISSGRQGSKLIGFIFFLCSCCVPCPFRNHSAEKSLCRNINALSKAACPSGLIIFCLPRWHVGGPPCLFLLIPQHPQSLLNLLILLTSTVLCSSKFKQFAATRVKKRFVLPALNWSVIFSNCFLNLCFVRSELFYLNYFTKMTQLLLEMFMF